MTVLKDGFMSLGFSVGDVVISSERRPDVPGDFAINHHMKMSTTGTSRFSTVKIDTVEGALRLRCGANSESYKGRTFGVWKAPSASGSFALLQSRAACSISALVSSRDENAFTLLWSK